MKILEDELGVRILILSNRGVRLTKEGTTLYEYAEDILKLMQDTKSTINKKMERILDHWYNTDRIGGDATKNLFALLMEENNDIGMSMKTQDKQQLQEMLFYSEIDVVFINGLFDEELFESAHSLSEDIVIFSHQDIGIREDGCPTLIINSDTTCTYRTKTFEAAKEMGYADPRIMEFDILESILNDIESGMGMSVIPKRVLDNRKAVQGINRTDLPSPVRIEFIVSLKRKFTKGLSKFILFLKSLSLSL